MADTVRWSVLLQYVCTVLPSRSSSLVRADVGQGSVDVSPLKISFQTPVKPFVSGKLYLRIQLTSWSNQRALVGLERGHLLQM